MRMSEEPVLGDEHHEAGGEAHDSWVRMPALCRGSVVPESDGRDRTRASSIHPMLTSWSSGLP